MTIQQIKDIEDCFDGSHIKEIIFKEPIQKEFIDSLMNIGNLKYYPFFSQPFFKLDVPDKFSVKGVEGNYSIRIVINKKETIHSFIKLISERRI